MDGGLTSWKRAAPPLWADVIVCHERIKKLLRVFFTNENTRFLAQWLHARMGGGRLSKKKNKELQSELDPVAKMVSFVVNTVLHEQGMEMVKYRKNLSQQIFSKLQGKSADMTRFC